MGIIWGVEVKKILKTVVLLSAWLLVTANVSAFSIVGGAIEDGAGNPVTGTYQYSGFNFHTPAPGVFDGDMGNVNIGLPGSPGDKIGTNFLMDAGTYAVNFDDTLAPDGSTVHWFKFTSSVGGVVSAHYEWDEGYWMDASSDVVFAIELFELDGSNTPFSGYAHTFTGAEIAGFTTPGHLDQSIFADIPAGDWLIRITGHGNDDGNGANDGYGVTFGAAAVPLPPAVLLFISALAGFGVIGRKKSRSA